MCIPTSGSLACILFNASPVSLQPQTVLDDLYSIASPSFEVAGERPGLLRASACARHVREANANSCAEVNLLATWSTNLFQHQYLCCCESPLPSYLPIHFFDLLFG